MTVSREPEQAELIPQAEPTPVEEVALPERPGRPQRLRRPRSEPNPALDPRLAQLERRSRRPSRAGDISLLFIGVAAFVFGVALHGWVAMSVLEDDGTAESAGETITATATPDDDSPSATPTVRPESTATTQPDRTNCEEIRGTQYRSVSEREFFLANCVSG